MKNCFYLLLLVVICDGFRVLGPSGPLAVQLGGSVMLPCFVESLLLMEELEVEWIRSESGTIVHLWQEGESRPESQSQSYRDRAHFFTEEVTHGNFSLLLTNVSREDAGVYKCVVHTMQGSNETLIELKENERLIVSGSHTISAYAGEDIILNCFVDSNIPLEYIEDVSWKKMDEDILVLLYQEGEVLTDSSHERYKDRVEFFSDEERNKGDFSMRMKDVQTDDKGQYICEVFTGALSANTTVTVQRLGFSSMHIGIFVLCILGFVIGSLILGYLSYRSFKNNDNSRRALAIQRAHIFCPNITMFIVFILWGVTEGSITEAATCSALNFVRIFFLLWISLRLKTVQDDPHPLIDHLAFPLEYCVIYLVAYSSLVPNVWYKLNTVMKVVLICLLMGTLLTLLNVCCRSKKTGINYISTEISNPLRIFIATFIYGLQNPTILIWVFFSFLPLFCYWILRRCFSLFWIPVMMILEVLSMSLSIYTHYVIVSDVNERDALTCVTAFLYILTMMTLFTSQKQKSESHSRNTETQQSLSHLVVYIFGTAVVVFVNVVALLIELILKALNGHRTVDLRVILLPTESVFVVCCLPLQIYTFWKNNRRLRETETGFSNLIGLIRHSNPPRTQRELENLTPVPQPSGS